MRQDVHPQTVVPGFYQGLLLELFGIKETLYQQHIYRLNMPVFFEFYTK
jgi:hypothetical protein